MQEEINKESTNLKENLASGLYYQEMLKFYNSGYINPFIERSFLYVASSFLFILLLILLYRIYDIFPLEREVRYIVNLKNQYAKKTTIIKANYYPNNAESSIAKILAEKYLKKREEYDYAKIEGQLKYILGSSSKLEFRKYYNYINIDNPESPILKYKKDIKRYINIKSVELDEQNDKFTIVFETTALNKNGEVIENNIYKATLNYIMKNMKSDDRTAKNFFSIIGYKVKLIKQNT